MINQYSIITAFYIRIKVIRQIKFFLFTHKKKLCGPSIYMEEEEEDNNSFPLLASSNQNVDSSSTLRRVLPLSHHPLEEWISSNKETIEEGGGRGGWKRFCFFRWLLLLSLIGMMVLFACLCFYMVFNDDTLSTYISFSQPNAVSPYLIPTRISKSLFTMIASSFSEVLRKENLNQLMKNTFQGRYKPFRKQTHNNNRNLQLRVKQNTRNSHASNDEFNNTTTSSTESSLITPSLVCPFLIYGPIWNEYWTNRSISNAYHLTTSNNKTIAADADTLTTDAILIKEYLPLYNQTEWVFKFPNQSSPLSCPKITINEKSKFVPIDFRYDADLGFYYGKEEAYCPEEDFPFGSICDKMFCFSPEMLKEHASSTANFNYGLNLTSLLIKDPTSIPESTIYTQQLSLSIMLAWLKSYLNGSKIPLDPLLSTKIWYNITKRIPELEEYRLGFATDILDLYTTCRACRDYSKYPVTNGFNICLNVNLPFQCSYGKLDLLPLGFPSMNQVQNYYGDWLSSSMCYCPRPGTSSINTCGTDIEINFAAEMSNIKSASMCDSYMYFWYPLYSFRIVNIGLLFLEIILALVIIMLIWLPLLVQFMKNILLMKKNVASLKIPNVCMCCLSTMSKSRKTSVHHFHHFQIRKSKTRWKQVLCDDKLNAASMLLFSFLCLLTSYACDFWKSNLSIMSDAITSMLFLIGLGNLFICAIPIISTWINAMQNDSNDMSMKISIPLIILQIVGSILTIFAPLFGYLYIFQVTNDYTALSLLYGMLFGIIFAYLVILIVLLLYSVKMFLRLRALINISFFQFRVSNSYFLSKFPYLRHSVHSIFTHCHYIMDWIFFIFLFHLCRDFNIHDRGRTFCPENILSI